MTDEENAIEAKIGSHAPDFSLLSTNGNEIRLSEFRGRKNIILFFVREFN